LKDVSIKISQSLYEIEEARGDLNSLYDHMAYSTGAIKDDLRGLDVAIEILSKISTQLVREENDGF
jgi:hypothetical protein